jgi:hypothetical protein
MTRKLDAAQDGASPVLSLRLSPALAAALAAEAHRRSTAAGGVPVSPAAVARVLLERALLVDPSSSTPNPPAAVTDAAPQEAAQRPRRGSTPRSTGRRAEAVAEPPTPAREADDGNDQEEADARHAARGAAHTELARIEALRADLCALIERGEWSGRRIGPAIGVSGRTVSQFVNGSTEGWPKWGDAARAWLDALPPAASSPDLQRPLFTAGSPNDDAS